VKSTDTRAAPAANACLMSFSHASTRRGSEPTGSVGIPVAFLGS